MIILEQSIQILQGIGLSIADMFLQMAPYLLLGLTFAGILHILFSKELIARHLGKGNIASVLKAAFLGVPLPLCSCGVIPTALSLKKSNASHGATMSFLISTPQTGVDSILATWGMLGPFFAVFRPLAALVMGIVGGISTNLLAPQAPRTKNDAQERVCVVCAQPGTHLHSWKEKIRTMVGYAYGTFLDDISLQLVIGIVLSGLISFLVPPGFFETYVGPGIFGMLLMIVAGIPLYVCATASIPIAAALMSKGLSPGAAFVFLVVGPATNAATITLIANAMGKRIVAIYLTTLSVMAVLGGLLLNTLFSTLDVDLSTMPAFHQHHTGPSIFTLTVSLVFLIMLLLSLGRRFAGGRRRSDSDLDPHASQVLTIEGMTCNHCATHVRSALRDVPGCTDARVDHIQGRAVCYGAVTSAQARKAVESAGYRVVDT